MRPLPENTTIQHGKHAGPDDGGCVMEWTSWVAGEEWTDRPACACPVLTAFALRINDRMPDRPRQRLLPYVPRLAGSRSDPDRELRRGFLAADRAVRVFAPLALDAAGLGGEAAALRGLAEVSDAATARSAYAATDAAADAAAYAPYAYAAAYAATAYAADAASYAAAAYAYAAAGGDAAAAAASAAYAAADAAAYAAYAAYAADAADAYAAADAAYAADAAGAVTDGVPVWDEALRLLDDLIAA
jgi:hypothetical protein